MSYYGYIPGFEDVKAEIEAPSTKKAKTVLLRYLASRGLISHAQKEQIRDKILVKRMYPGQFPTTVKLTYSGEVEEGRLVSPGSTSQEMSTDYPPVSEESRETETEPLPAPGNQARFQPRPQPQRNIFGDSKVAELSKRWGDLSHMRRMF
jgi:hypothetical protein